MHITIKYIHINKTLHFKYFNLLIIFSEINIYFIDSNIVSNWVIKLFAMHPMYYHQNLKLFYIGKLVANSCEFIQSHLHIFVRSGYTPLTVRYRGGPSCILFSPKIVHFHTFHIVWIHTKSLTRKIVKIRMWTKQGVDNKDFKIPEQIICMYLVVI